MKKTKITLVSLLLFGVFLNTFAAESEYNLDSKVLRIPIIKIGDSHVYNATLKLNEAGSFDIIGYSENPPSRDGDDSVTFVFSDECKNDNISLDKSNQIKAGMSLEQVYSIIGCKEESSIIGSDTSMYFWDNEEAELTVMFEGDSVSIALYTQN